MKNLFNPNIQCTDPDNLQFCQILSDTEFWYCEPNIYNEQIYSDGTPENTLYKKYKGNPMQLLVDAGTNAEVKKFVSNRLLWLTGLVNINDFSTEEKKELLNSYGYVWNTFLDDKERNQIICENYFEQNPMEFRDDI